MPEISLNHGSSEGLSVSPPALSGRFIAAVDNPDFRDGFGLIAQWGATGLQRATPSAESIASSVSDSLSGLSGNDDAIQRSVDGFADFLSGLAYEPFSLEVATPDLSPLLQGLQGLQAPPDKSAKDFSVPAVSHDLVSTLRSIAPKDSSANIYYNLNRGIVILENRTFDPADPETGRIWIRTDL